MREVPLHLAGQWPVAGLIPPGSTAYHLLLAVHIAAGLTCVVTGAVAALSPKRPGRHPRLGTPYYRSLSVMFVTAAWLAALRWPQDAYLLVLGTVSLAAATFGRTARRRRWRWHRWRWIGLHLTGMSASYVLLLTAFYVDNGKNLPVWQRLPHLAYWLLPSAVGLPLVVRALVRHRGFATRGPTNTWVSCDVLNHRHSLGLMPRAGTLDPSPGGRP
jgi:hypothetical protein